jgi:WD40 repeat protein
MCQNKVWLRMGQRTQRHRSLGQGLQHTDVAHSFMLAPLACLLIVIMALPLQAQYFGQNKVRHESLDFKVLKTEHFDIHYYDEEREPATEVGRMAERWYARLSKVLNHELSSRQPIILYADHPDFRGTSVIPGHIGETTGGVTEGLRRRLVMPLAGPLAETDHVLGHELVHAFQFDITSRAGPQSGLSGALRLPLWFVEGMAEYLSLGPVDAHTAMWMRDGVAKEKLPTVRELDHPRYFPYRYGQAFWAFVAARYGDEVIGGLLRSSARSGDIQAAIRSVLDVSAEQLSDDWQKALLQHYEPVLHATRPADQGARLLVSKEGSGGEINVSPVISPDGKQMVLYSEKELFSIEMFLADAESGKVQRKITKTAVDPHFDSLQFVNSAGAWSLDGKRVAFGGISNGRPQISIYDVGKKQITLEIPVRQVGEIFSVTWSPDGKSLAFSAVAGGVTDLFVLDVSTKEMKQLTNDSYADLQPAWSPNGERIAFVTDRFTSDLSLLSFGHYQLALVDPKTGMIRPVRAFESGKHINPQWSREGQSLYFVSDCDGISNIYRASLKDGIIRQVTNIQTGVSGITKLSPAFSAAARADRLVFSAFVDGEYKIFRIDSETELAGRLPSDRLTPLKSALLPPQAESETLSLLQESKVGLAAAETFTSTNYKPKLSLDYIAPPNVAVGFSEFGSLLGGGTALYFSDLLGQHNLMTAFQINTFGEASDIGKNIAAIAGYQKQKSRWTWGFVGGQVPFLTGGYGSTLANVDGQPVVVEQAVTAWQINRELAGTLAYPFNRAQRIEFTAGFRNIDLSAKARTRAFSLATGQLLLDQSQEIPTPDSLHMGTASAALVYDTSLFGGTSPVRGQRYRLELGAAGGSVNYSNVLVDYRRYFGLARPLSLAGRFLHFGRYGGDAEDVRLQDLFVGYPSLVRGYDPGSFHVNECGTNTTGRCPVFDRLFGSRIAVGNAELRLSLLGPLGVVPSRSVPPVETALFYDSAVAWTSARQAELRDVARKPISSYGASLRFNILGFAVGQLSYVRPIDRPLKGWHWQFSLLPGF